MSVFERFSFENDRADLFWDFFSESFQKINSVILYENHGDKMRAITHQTAIDMCAYLDEIADDLALEFFGTQGRPDVSTYVRLGTFPTFETNSIFLNFIVEAEKDTMSESNITHISRYEKRIQMILDYSVYQESDHESDTYLMRYNKDTGRFICADSAKDILNQVSEFTNELND